MSKHLAIEIGERFIRLSELNNGAVQSGKIFELPGTNPDEKKSALKEIFSGSAYDSTAFDEVTLGWVTRESTLVPSNVFGDTDPASVYKLCFGATQEYHQVDYNRISELSVVNIYQIAEWIKSFFVMRYPRITIQHIGSHLVRNMLHSNAFYLKGSLILFDGYFLLAISRHNNLEFYSYFDFQSAEDVIYHLSFALQQKEMTDERGSIELISSGNVDQSFSSTITEIAKKMGNLSKLEFVATEDYIAKSQLLCV